MDAAVLDRPDAGKTAGLRRMRRTATCLLGVMLAVLLASVVLEGRYPWLAWVRAFAEAATVGAVADWYAVVALFRRPFGLAIPHTAIIPRNQQRIAVSLGNFIEENFLTPELIVSRLREYNSAQAIGRWLAAPANSRVVADVVADSMPGLLEGIDAADVERFADRVIVPRLKKLDVSRVAGELLKILTEGDRHQPLLDRGLLGLERWLNDNIGLIEAKFGEASKYTPSMVDAYIVRKFVEGIIALLHEVVANPDHVLRDQFDQAVRDFIGKLQTSPAYRRFGRTLLRDCLRHVQSADYYGVALDYVRTRMIADLGREDSTLRGMGAGVLASLGESVADDAALQRKLNDWWLGLAHQLVVRYRRPLAGLVTEVVKSWDAGEVSSKIEAEIGRDLQFIRINGTVVGGLVGLALHAMTVLLTR